jgi:hypothetical protein
MKKFALGSVLSLGATSAFAGGLAAPIVEAPVVAAATSSSAGIAVPLILLAIVAAAIVASR